MVRPIALAVLLVATSGMAGAYADDLFQFESRFRLEAPDPDPVAERTLLTGRVEGSLGGLYGGVGGQTPAAIGQASAIDVYIGMRPELGPLDVDLGYRRRVSPGDAPCCGRLDLRVSRPLGGAVRIGGGLRFDPGTATGRAEATASLPGPGRTRLSARLGSDFAADTATIATAQAPDLRLAASRRLGPGTRLDLRVSGGPDREGTGAIAMRLEF